MWFAKRILVGFTVMMDTLPLSSIHSENLPLRLAKGWLTINQLCLLGEGATSTPETQLRQGRGAE